MSQKAFAIVLVILLVLGLVVYFVFNDDNAGEDNSSETQLEQQGYSNLDTTDANLQAIDETLNYLD